MSPGASRPAAWRRALRGVVRWSKRLAWLLLGLLSFTLLCLSLLLFTAKGRELLWDAARGPVGELVPGSIAIERIDQLSPFGVELVGLEIRDPQGTPVIELKRGRIGTDLSGLIRGVIAIDELVLEGVRVDASTAEPRAGLVAAFVDPDAPSSPPSDAPPPDIVVHHIRLDDVHISPPKVDDMGKLEVQLSSLRGSFSLLKGVVAGEVQDLKAEAQRDGETILQVQGTGLLAEDDSPSMLTLSVNSLGMNAELSASFASPLRPGWEKEPAHVALSVSGVRADRLAKLSRQPDLEEAFQGELGLELEVTGPPETPRAAGVISTAGGNIQIDQLELSRARGKLQLTLLDLSPHEVRRDLPQKRVDASLTIEARGLDQDQMAFDVRLREARLDETALPEVDLAGQLRKDRVDPLSLAIRQGDSGVYADGKIGFDGSAHLALRIDLRQQLVSQLGKLVPASVGGRLTGHLQLVREESGRLSAEGKVHVAEASYDSARLDSADANVSVAGSFPNLSGKAVIAMSGASIDGYFVDELTANLEGGPTHYEVELEGAGGLKTSTLDRRASLQLHADVARKASSTAITSSVRAQTGESELQVDVSPTEIDDHGAFETEGIRLVVDGQQIQIRGGYGGHARKRKDGLHVTTGTLDLEKLGALANLDQKVRGNVQLEADLKGTADAPLLALSLAAEKVGLKGKPTVDVNLEFELDAARGSVLGNVDAKSGGALSARLDAHAELPTGGNLPSRLGAAEGQATLSVGRLDFDFLRAYLPPGALPVDGRARGEFRLSGSPQSPELKADTHLSLGDGASRASVAHTLSYGGGSLRTKLEIGDAKGEWAVLVGSMTLPGGAPAAAELPAAFTAAPSAATWQVELAVEKRELRELPLLPYFVTEQDIPPLLLSLNLEANHKSDQEPQINLDVLAEQSQKVALEDCDVSGLQATLSYRHEGRDNELRLSAGQDGQQALVATVKSQLELAPLLSGHPVTPGPVDFDLQTEDLQIGSLPVVCGRARGVVTARGTGRHLLGKEPNLELDLSARSLTLGPQGSLDVDVAADLTRKGGSLEARLGAKGFGDGRGATLRARVPWEWSDGHFEIDKDLPLDAQLEVHHLPLAPLLPPKGAISYASGSIEGKLAASGTLSHPQVHGQLELEDIAFTSTAIAQPLRGVVGVLKFDGRQLAIEGFEAHDRDGTLQVDGQIDLDDTEHLEGTINVVARDFPLRQQGQVVAITNLRARAHSIVEPEQTVAELQLMDVDTWLLNASIRSGISLEGHPEFVIDGEVPEELEGRLHAASGTPEQRSSTRQQSEQKSSTAPPHAIHIKIDAQERFWVKRSDFAVKLSALLDTHVVGDEVRVKGEVRIDRGYLQLFGKVFDLQRDSDLSFIGSSPPNPVLNLEAEHKTRNNSIVSVRITGRGDEPKLAFFVDGVEVDASIAVEELFGASQSGDDEKDAATQAQGFVSGLTAGVLATAARKELGAAAPIVMIDPSDEAGEGRVRAGFELDEIIPEFLKPIVTGVYLEGIVARESEGDAPATTSFGTLLEVYFPKNFFAAGQYGPGTTWSVDFGWQL